LAVGRPFVLTLVYRHWHYKSTRNNSIGNTFISGYTHRGRKVMPKQRSETTIPRPGGKEGTSFRLTPQAKELIAKLATRLGITQAGVIEVAIREKAQREGVE